MFMMQSKPNFLQCVINSDVNYQGNQPVLNRVEIEKKSYIKVLKLFFTHTWMIKWNKQYYGSSDMVKVMEQSKKFIYTAF